MQRNATQNGTSQHGMRHIDTICICVTTTEPKHLLVNSSSYLLNIFLILPKIVITL